MDQTWLKDIDSPSDQTAAVPQGKPHCMYNETKVQIQTNTKYKYKYKKTQNTNTNTKLTLNTSTKLTLIQSHLQSF